MLVWRAGVYSGSFLNLILHTIWGCAVPYTLSSYNSRHHKDGFVILFIIIHINSSFLLSHNQFPHYILKESRFSVYLFVVVARLTPTEGKTTVLKGTSALDGDIHAFNFPLLQDNGVKRQLINNFMYKDIK